jgi:predicted small lipoprotein YifL
MISRSTIAMLMAAMVAVPLTGCGQKPGAEGAGAAKKSDTKAWEGPATNAVYGAEGFKSGDKTAWEAQLKARTERGQNEYTRTTSGKK